MSDVIDFNQVTTKHKAAEDAGTENGHLCSLIVADGYTGINVAEAGLSVVGRNRYGMCGLINFTQNFRDKNDVEVTTQFKFLVAILGLEFNVDYSNEAERKKLRYGKLMILTDQNEFGSNFKGLIINIIYLYWPQLLQLTPSFLEDIVTPVVKVKRGENTLSFYSVAEFEEWKKLIPDVDAYSVMYFRFLSTHSTKDVKEYFSKLDFHRVKFQYGGPEDDTNLIKAFRKDALQQRKEWLTQHMDERKGQNLHAFQNSTLYKKKTNKVTYSDFINLELVYVASFNKSYSIPSVVDGFKPGQRKVLFTCIKRKFELHVTVTQLALFVIEDTSYYERKQTLCMVIYNMARDYFGSDNLNLLIPFDQFATRSMGGEHHADPFNLRILMSTIARLIFHPHDDPLLSYKSGVEPDWYIPVIPMLLVNGSVDQGTGCSTNIPKHDPHQIIRIIRNMIAGVKLEVLTPFYRNFRGTIQVLDNARFITIGCVAIIEDEKIAITELPIGICTMVYKQNVLEQLLHGSETVAPIITDYKEYHTDITVRFVVTFAPGEFQKLRNEINGFHRVFQLYGIIKTDKLNAFDGSNTLRKYESADDILQEFYDLRLKYYAKRKKYLEKKLTAEADKLRNQARFVLAICDNTLVVENKKRKETLDKLTELGYEADPVEKWKEQNGIEVVRKELKNLPDDEKTDVKKFDYLLTLTLTEECRNELTKKYDNKMAELKALKTKSKYDLWLADLAVLETELKALAKKKQVNLSKRLDDKDLYPSENGKNVECHITDLFDKMFAN